MSNTNQKIEAVERASAMCKRAAPSLIAKGNLTKGQASILLDTLNEVALDYHSQALEEKNGTRGGCSKLSIQKMSINLNDDAD